MPELPEVQTIINDLNRSLVGRKILTAWWDWSRMFKLPTKLRSLKRDIRSKRIVKVERRAKYIKIFLTADYLLAVHLKMTGRFYLVPQNLATPKWRKEHYVHVMFSLDKKMVLAFSDVRKFGTMRFGKSVDIENLPEFKALGPEPLAKGLTLDKFAQLITKPARAIKQVLMDPKIIVGIGNIYSDEALWLSKIHPLRKANALKSGEIKKLFINIKKVLRKSLNLRGTSSRDYRDLSGQRGNYYDQRLVYHREGEQCRRCKAKIKRLRLGGRSAHFCPRCQKAG
ncbi:MAG: bifunctional DNA-formamidopyrimidine glycosylase/DNA-(apurinic or apyrimidinic site) lyase [bacterium]|nr:bifunctional DNA-formamidopyrimidine glycosylase/DNA-(apurinic or apyrimidinic site) lyase [bacterium]